jgi:hypothetical protein
MHAATKVSREAEAAAERAIAVSSTTRVADLEGR